MLKFYAHNFVAITMKLASLSQQIYIDDRDIKVDLDSYNIIKEIEILYDLLIGVDLKLSAKSALRVKSLIHNDGTIEKYYIKALEELSHIINDELEERHIYIISKDKDTYYNPDIPIFGKSVVDKFPELIEDIYESGNCYALNRNTACVFHLMRIMEKSVQRLANKLGIPTTFTRDEEWQTILNVIRGRLKTLYPKGSNPDRIKYESILAHLETIKIAWRNPTMHPKATYTEEEAKALLDAVGIFLKDLIKVI